VPVDAKEAVNWLRKAAKQGDSLAMSLLPVAEKQLKGSK
jgi:TPR repeat protein